MTRPADRRRAIAFVAIIAAWLVGGAPSPGAVELGECADMVREIGAPIYRGNPPDHAVLCRHGYVLAHNSDRRTPDWVVERLTPDRFSGPADRKLLKEPFAADPDLAAGERAELGDYRRSGFDRGHMAPAADMKFSLEALKESFYLSNMTPQVGKGLNRHIWADLEALVRDWTCDRGNLVVVTGPIYDMPEERTIGPNRIAVPSAFYKIVYDPARRRAIAFILPNQAVDKRGQSAWEALKPHIVSVREVEQRVSLDFFNALPRRDESRIERLRSTMWPVREGCAR